MTAAAESAVTAGPHGWRATTSGGPSEDLARRLELLEAEAWSDFHRSAPPDLARREGIEAVDLAGGRLALASRIDVLALNRAVGLGLVAPVREREVDAALGVFRTRGAPRFFVQASPLARPGGLEAILRDRGGHLHNRWVRLARRLGPVASPPTSLVVRRVGPENARDFGRVFAEAFGWPGAAEWVGATVGRPGWRHYLAWDRGVAVATGALYRAGRLAWFDFASTLPTHRGRGAQSALLARRISDAADLGCDWGTMETADDAGSGAPQSLRNALRAGFEILYRRPNYLFAGGVVGP